MYHKEKYVSGDNRSIHRAGQFNYRLGKKYLSKIILFNALVFWKYKKATILVTSLFCRPSYFMSKDYRLIE